MDADLFRSDVLPSDSKRAVGRVVLMHPASNWVFAALGAAVFLATAVLLAVGQYTRHEEVRGVLEPEAGVVKLYAPQAGTLKMVAVHEGARVRRGDVLLVFATEHRGTSGIAMETEVADQTRRRLDAQHSELADTLRLQDQDAAQLRQSLAALLTTADSLRSQLALLERRSTVATAAVNRFEDLRRSGFASDDMVEQKRADLLDLQVRQESARKDMISAQADIARTQQQLRSAPDRKEVSRAQLERDIASTRAQLAQQVSGQDWSIVAPCDGLVSALDIGEHQAAAPNVPLVTLLPDQGTLRASLYVPSRSIGFMQAGQPVHLKLAAFPYQKFGVVNGRIEAISQTPVSASEISSGTRLMPDAAGNAKEPLYGVRVKLDAQSIVAYGQDKPLLPGMQLDADIQLETRQIYEWILEPLYSAARG